MDQLKMLQDGPASCNRFLEHGTKPLNFLSITVFISAFETTKENMSWCLKSIWGCFFLTMRPGDSVYMYSYENTVVWKGADELYILNDFCFQSYDKITYFKAQVVISWRHLEMWGWNWNMYVNIFEVYICVDTCLNFKPVSIHACMIIYLCNICNKYIIFLIIYMLYRLRLSIYHILIYIIYLLIPVDT